MPPIMIATSARIQATAEDVFGVFADYRRTHARILPPRYFADLKVEAGGFGAGTRIRFKCKVMGLWREYVAEISTPVPGRVLVERIESTGLTTTFSVREDDENGFVVARIETSWGAKGPLSWLAGKLAARSLIPIYREELRLLAEVTREIASGPDKSGDVAKAGPNAIDESRRGEA